MKIPEPRQAERVTIAHIDVGNNRRPVDEATVRALMDSLATLGLQSPICVRYLPNRPSDDGARDDSFVLIYGRHRLEAAKRLGWKSIEAFESDLSDLRAELAEIDENLIRTPLTPAQEASAVFRRKQIYEELHPETKHGGNAGGPSGQFVRTADTAFATATAEATGKDECTVRRAAARGEALGSDLDAVTGTSLDKGVELDALAKMEPAQRAPIIERARSGENVSARFATDAHKHEADAVADMLGIANGLAERFSHRELRELIRRLEEIMRPRAVK